jgi:hypothetical protein
VKERDALKAVVEAWQRYVDAPSSKINATLRDFEATLAKAREVLGMPPVTNGLSD